MYTFENEKIRKMHGDVLLYEWSVAATLSLSLTLIPRPFIRSFALAMNTCNMKILSYQWPYMFFTSYFTTSTLLYRFLHFIGVSFFASHTNENLHRFRSLNAQIDFHLDFLRLINSRLFIPTKQSFGAFLICSLFLFPFGESWLIS